MVFYLPRQRVKSRFLFFPDWMPDHGLELCRRAFPRIAQVDLMVVEHKLIARIMDELVK